MLKLFDLEPREGGIVECVVSMLPLFKPEKIASGEAAELDSAIVDLAHNLGMAVIDLSLSELSDMEIHPPRIDDEGMFNLDARKLVPHENAMYRASVRYEQIDGTADGQLNFMEIFIAKDKVIPGETEPDMVNDYAFSMVQGNDGWQLGIINGAEQESPEFYTTRRNVIAAGYIGKVSLDLLNEHKQKAVVTMIDLINQPGIVSHDQISNDQFSLAA